jgi:glyoxylase-like metal-dependent hydrolase (beta-lactamase superfamily II)
MAHISPNPLLTLAPGSDSERTRSLPTYLESLARLRTFDIETGYAGHGETIQTLDERIGEILAHHQDRKQNIESIIRAQGPVSAYAIMQELFPDLPATEMFPGMSEVIGHLDLLEDERKVTLSRNGDDVWVYGFAT